MASSGDSRIAAAPNPSATRTPARVAARCLAHPVMTRSIRPTPSPLSGRRAQAALGGHEEVARGHDALATREPVAHLVPVAGSRAERDVARREPAVAEIDEHDATL